ncbi:MAG: AAA family ATPase [Treponema sp.]|jgi:MoxR-like ATPase|nr:AAA family ATPase [Treponema sp.]
MLIKPKIQALLGQLNKGIYEKEEALALTLLTSIAGESIFLLGPPGVAKSLIARKLKFAYTSGKVFEYLMSRFSTPEDIFGPVSISKLKNEDKYERLIDRYLPASEVVFLDEIWKAGPSIQNMLLTVINEKIFRNGDKEIKIPLKALVSASNELPAKNEGLEALWDRFLVRLIVHGIESKESFSAMISEHSNAYEDTVDSKNKITDEEYQTWSTLINLVKIPKNVFNVIHHVRHYIAEYNKANKENQIYISDRRWRKIVRLMRTSAFLNDRDEVDLMDCFLIKHCIWNEKEHIDTVYRCMKDTIEKFGYTVSLDFKGIQDEITEFKKEIDEETLLVKDTRKQVLVEQDGFYEIENPPDSSAKFIIIDVYKRLSTSEQNQYLWCKRLGKYDQYKPYNIKKGHNEFSFIISNKEYVLKTRLDGEKKVQTKKPNLYTEAAWDNRVKKLLEIANNWKLQIEQYHNKDLKYLRTNLFVRPECAAVVESHITKTIKEIEKIEIEIRGIHHRYKIIKEETDIEHLNNTLKKLFAQ